jgi:RimJ/RimL family protein N-acetyltransferase
VDVKIGVATRRRISLENVYAQAVSGESFAGSVPRIATARLLLREYQLRDFDAYAENLSDPVATAHLSGVVDRRTAWRNFAAGMGFWMLHGAGWWGVELKETGELVGSVGAFYRESPRELEIGWALYRRFWRQGYATEAATAALGFGFETLGERRAIAHIDAENTASIRVSEHLGMRHEADVDFYGSVVGRYATER